MKKKVARGAHAKRSRGGHRTPRTRLGVASWGSTPLEAAAHVGVVWAGRLSVVLAERGALRKRRKKLGPEERAHLAHLDAEIEAAGEALLRSTRARALGMNVVDLVTAAGSYDDLRLSRVGLALSPAGRLGDRTTGDPAKYAERVADLERTLASAGRALDGSKLRTARRRFLEGRDVRATFEVAKRLTASYLPRFSVQADERSEKWRPTVSEIEHELLKDPASVMSGGMIEGDFALVRALAEHLQPELARVHHDRDGTLRGKVKKRAACIAATATLLGMGATAVSQMLKKR